MAEHNAFRFAANAELDVGPGLAAFCEASGNHGFQGFQRKGTAASKSKACDALAEVAVKRRVGMDEGRGGVVLDVTNKGREFFPFLVFETNVDLLLMFEQVARNEFFFAFIHGPRIER